MLNINFLNNWHLLAIFLFPFSRLAPISTLSPKLPGQSDHVAPLVKTRLQISPTVLCT